MLGNVCVLAPLIICALIFVNASNGTSSTAHTIAKKVRNEDFMSVLRLKVDVQEFRFVVQLLPLCDLEMSIESTTVGLETCLDQGCVARSHLPLHEHLLDLGDGLGGVACDDLRVLGKRELDHQLSPHSMFCTFQALDAANSPRLGACACKRWASGKNRDNQSDFEPAS
jgi:hypothetical protein